MEQQTIRLPSTLLRPSGCVRFLVQLVAILPGSGDLIILGQKRLQEVLCVDVMEDLKRLVTGSNSKMWASYIMMHDDPS